MEHNPVLLNSDEVCSRWVDPNRAMFPAWMVERFRKYQDKDPNENENLFRHQRIIRELMRPGSPFRGLVVFHGLGVGKTCAAVAVAEMLRSSVSKVVVITQASLRNTFYAEMVKCGAGLRFSRGPDSAWRVDEAGTRVADMSERDRADFEPFLQNLVRERYAFINYNGGVTEAKLESRYTREFFDGALVIIDEAHRFVSLAMRPGSIGHQLYGRVYLADCRLLLLTGTPIVNVPFELALLLNLAHGRRRCLVMRGFRRTALEQLRSDPAVESAELSRDERELVVTPATGVDVTRHLLPHGTVEIQACDNLPMEEADFDRWFCNAERTTVRNPMLFMRRATGLVSHFDQRDESLYPRLSEREVVKVQMSDHQFGYYVRIRIDEIRKERIRSKFAIEARPTANYKSRSRLACNFAFPDSVPRPGRVVERVDESSGEEEVVTAHERGLGEALARLEDSGALAPERLPTYSPKMAAIGAAIEASPGKCLVYSEFRTVEGLAILSMSLEARGQRRVDVVTERGQLKVHVGPGDSTKPCFAVYHADNHAKASMIVDLFNGSFDKDGPEIKSLLVSRSGSEGISLKNVRQVHLLEPYWNDIRAQQVIGRAVRAGSHASLPVEQRTVRVFQYVATFPPEAIDKVFVLRAADDGLSADEMLMRISERKARLSGEFLGLLRAASVDCGLYAESGCFGLPMQVADAEPVKTVRFEDELDDRRYGYRLARSEASVPRPVRRLELEGEDRARIFVLQLDDGRLVDADVYRLTGRYKFVELQL